jgi:hypothetical protein
VPFVALSMITAPIGFVLGELLLATMFFGVFLPVGLAFRLAGRNPLQWRFEPHSPTYWQSKTCGREPAAYFRQY